MKTSRKARVAAASEGKSLSRFIAEMVERRVGQSATQHDALERFLASPKWESDGSPVPTREEIYAERFRRYEPAALRLGRGGAREGDEGAPMAGGADPPR